MSYISLKNVSKEYKVNNEIFKALDDVSIDIESGEFVIILGTSGSGKSTLLNIIGGMDKHSKGSVIIDDLSLDGMSNKSLSKYRKDYVGFIFQSYNLIGNLTAVENVMLSNNNITYDMALDALKKLDVDSKASMFPSNISGGEAQRVSIARAIVKKPRLLLCDEPKGALDTKNGDLVMEYLSKMCKEMGQTVIAVTHNPDYVKYATKLIRLRDGKIESGDSNGNS